MAGILALLATGRAATAADQSSEPTFHAFLVQLDSAQRDLQNGRPTPFKELWSHADDITLSGGFGGTIEKGWDQISKRLDWVGAQFTNGTNTIERISAQTSGDLGYVVQLEHIRFTVPGQPHQSTRDYRVTMLFRRENGNWRIIHRQAAEHGSQALAQRAGRIAQRGFGHGGQQQHHA